MANSTSAIALGSLTIPIVGIIAIFGIAVTALVARKTLRYSSRKADSDNLVNSEKLVQHGQPYLDAVEALRINIETRRGDHKALQKAYIGKKRKVEGFYDDDVKMHVAALHDALTDLRRDLLIIQDWKGSYINNTHPGIHDRVGEARGRLAHNRDELDDMLNDPGHIRKV